MAVQWGRLLARESVWDKDELLDVIFWLRVILGLATGVGCGIVGVEGVTGFIAFFVLAFFGTQAFVVRQKVDVSICGPQELAAEGFAGGFFSFLASWIVLYSTFHA